MIEYSEPYTQPDLQNRSQIDRKSIANDSLNTPINSSNLETVSTPEVDHKNQAQVTSQPAIDSPANSDQQVQVGDRAIWSECPAHCESLSPFEVVAIDGDYAKLDLFPKLVLRSQLRRAN